MAVVETSIRATGYRVNPTTGDFPTEEEPHPGNAIVFSGESRGLVADPTLTGNFGHAVAVEDDAHVETMNNNTFDNGRD